MFLACISSRNLLDQLRFLTLQPLLLPGFNSTNFLEFMEVTEPQNFPSTLLGPPLKEPCTPAILVQTPCPCSLCGSHAHAEDTCRASGVTPAGSFRTRSGSSLRLLPPGTPCCGPLSCSSRDFSSNHNSKEGTPAPVQPFILLTNSQSVFLTTCCCLHRDTCGIFYH